MNQTMSTLQAMRRQETTSYHCEDYLQGALQQQSFIDDIFNSPQHTTAEYVEVLKSNRKKMAQWCMTLMDACQLSRETVSIAMSYFDRFMATEQGAECIDDSATFQLSAMTSLYSAIKIHEEKAISPEVLCNISRGFYSKKDMEEMEWRMLNALQWRVNVPTPLAFVREYLNMIPNKVVNQETKDHLLELAKVQTEMSVADYSFVTVKASSIGFAALANAMDVLGLEFRIVNHYILSERNLVDTQEVLDIQGALFAAVSVCSFQLTFNQQPSSHNKNGYDSQPKPRRASHTISPRTVVNHAA
jgi:hypothetical protein